MAFKVPVRERQVADPGAVDIQKAQPVSGVSSAALQQQKTVSSVLERMSEEHDKTKVQELYNNFSRTSRDQLFAIQDQFKGGDADKASTTYESWHAKESDRLTKLTENKRQERFLQSALDNSKDRHLNGLAAYQATEHQKWRASVLDGTLQTLEEDVIAEPTRLDDSIQAAEALIDDHGKGLDNTVAKSKVRASMTTGAILQLATNGRQAEASQFLDRAAQRQDISPDVQQKLKETISKYLLRDTSAVMADEIRARYPDDLEKQINASRKVSAEGLDKAELRDEVNKRVKGMFDEDKKIQDDAQQKRAEGLAYQVFQLIGQGRSQQQVEDEILVQVDRGDGKNYKALNDLIRSEFKKEEKDTDWDVYQQAWGEIERAAETGQKIPFERIQLDYGPRISDKDMVSLRRHNESAGKLVTTKSYSSAKEEIDKAYNSGIFGKPKKPNALATKSSLEQELAEYMELNPKGEPAKFMRERIKVIEQEKMAKDLNNFKDIWANISPSKTSSRELLEKMTDDDLARELVQSFGKDASNLTDRQIRRIILTPDFQDFKNRKLQELEQVNK